MAQHARWIWIIWQLDKPTRVYPGSLMYGAQFASGFGSKKEADRMAKRQREFCNKQREVCRKGGSEIGVDSWTKQSESIRVIRIERPEYRTQQGGR